MNVSVRNYLSSAFSWSLDKLVKLQRWLQTSWISGCTKGLSQSLWWMWELLGTSKGLPDTFLLEQGNQEWKPETGDYSSAGWCYSFPIFPSVSVPEVFFIWMLVWATGGCFCRTSVTTPLSYTLLQPGTQTWVETLMQADYLPASLQQYLKYRLFHISLNRQTTCGSVLLYLTPFSSNNQRHVCSQYSESHFND